MSWDDMGQMGKLCGDDGSSHCKTEEDCSTDTNLTTAIMEDPEAHPPYWRVLEQLLMIQTERPFPKPLPPPPCLRGSLRGRGLLPFHPKVSILEKVGHS
jgi:hypothetical protein